MEAKVTKEARLAIFTDIHQQWVNQREAFTIQHRVFKRLNDKDGMERAEKELTRCETALDELDKIFAEMQGGKEADTKLKKR